MMRLLHFHSMWWLWINSEIIQNDIGFGAETIKVWIWFRPRIQLKWNFIELKIRILQNQSEWQWNDSKRIGIFQQIQMKWTVDSEWRASIREDF